MKNGIVSPVGLAVMGTAILLGGFVTPVFAFLGAAFGAEAVRSHFAGRRRAVATVVRHRAF